MTLRNRGSLDGRALPQAQLFQNYCKEITENGQNSVRLHRGVIICAVTTSYNNFYLIG